MQNTSIKDINNNFRFILLSDTHGYLNPNIFNLVQENDYVFHAGDIMDENIIDSLLHMSKRIITVLVFLKILLYFIN